MDSTDSVVMGGQKKRDTLAEMPRFGGRNVQDGEVFPVWLKELTKKVKFDVGDIGVRIIEGEVRRGDIKTGDRAYDHRDLALNLQECVTNVLKSYYNSIAEYGLVQGSEVYKEYVKLEDWKVRTR
eukprot:g2541.t1